MFILEIAAGIVLAVLVLRLLPLIIISSLLIGCVALVFVLLLLVWLNLEKVAIYVAALGAVGLLYGVPFWLQSKITEKYPEFGKLVRGEPPFNEFARQPKRLLIMALFALVVAGAGLATLFGAVHAVDLLSQVLVK
jgi:hypothetical protein